MTAASTIWGLLDDRPGHANQVRGVMAQLGAAQGISLSYNVLSQLPNALLGASVKHVSAQAKAQLKAPWPDIVIACGRRTIPVARWIKQQHPGVKLVYLMWPDAPSAFDLIFAPAHDEPPPLPNVVTTLGPLHAITPEALEVARLRWQETFSHLPTPHIGVLVGGARKGGCFCMEEAKQLVLMAQSLSEEGALIITTSRRTPTRFYDEVLPLLSHSYYLYDWRSGDDNPYLGILACTDALVVAGDSLSMCAEAAAAGKPLFIQSNAMYLPEKHIALHEALFAQGVARPLSPCASLGWTPKASLYEAKRVAELIHERLISGV